uniref:Ig-like domain-containing protein n=1 Tax=Anolis carolinensis TaxID=28377 RepID=A0A803SZR7_ANOCA
MGRGRLRLPVAALGLLFAGAVVVFAQKSASETGLSIKVKQNGRNVTLQCSGGSEGSEPFTWEKDGHVLDDHKGELLPLGSEMDDPRGSFSCSSGDQTASLQVFFRMCQNCIHLDVPTIVGIVIASLVATLFLAVAVFFLAVEEPSLRSQASDKQNLLANEQLYQVSASVATRLASASLPLWSLWLGRSSYAWGDHEQLLPLPRAVGGLAQPPSSEDWPLLLYLVLSWPPGPSHGCCWSLTVILGCLSASARSLSMA